MGRKSRTAKSGLVLVFFLMLLSFAIADWFGKDLFTVILVVLSLAILIMIGMIIWKQGRRIASRGSASVAKRESSLRPEQKWRTFLVLMSVGILALLILAARPIIDWFRQNLHTIIPVALLLAALAVTGTLVWMNRQKLVSGRSGGGTCLEDYTWPPQNMKDQLAVDLWQSIIDFKCKRYEIEYWYHLELFKWLQRKFPEAKMNQIRGSSRPDITIGNIAIEVKGPTKNSDLITIADKIFRYGYRYSLIFVVLFAPDVSRRRFDEWVAGARRESRKFGVITKE